MDIAFAIALVGLTLYALRGGLTASGTTAVSGFDTQGLMLGGLAFTAAAYLFGPMYGLALVLSVMIHEFGHVAAFRICGHDDARFRLIPLMGGVAISDRAPDTQGDDFFITLMGPAICLAPMILSFVLSDLVYPYSLTLSSFFWIFASVTAAMNFFNLLPFWPLDGGRCVRIVACAFWPGAAHFLTLIMSAALAATALSVQSMGLLFFALIGAQSLFTHRMAETVQHPMKRHHALLAAAAYFFTGAAHFFGGAALLFSLV